MLDEANATYDLNPAEARALWNFYGYIFIKYEDYDRAIAAYETAMSQPSYAGDTMQLTLAHLYFGRQQYGQALAAALEYIETAPNPVRGAFQFVDALRQLGIVERTP